MRCNACWRELEGQAVSTTCGHLLCTADASKILNSDGGCPICDQVLSKSLMRPVDINPNDEWVNMVMAGVSPQILMKSAYRSVMFYIGQKELEMQCKMNRLVTQCRQKCEAMQESFSEKMEQVHTAYQKMAKKSQMMEQEIQNLSKDKQELQEKFAEKSRWILSATLSPSGLNIDHMSIRKSFLLLMLDIYLITGARQKRKLDEMYDQLRSELDSVKRSAIQPANNFYSRAEPDLFSNPNNLMDNHDTLRKDGLVFTPETPGRSREDIWPAAARQNSSNSGGAFDVSANSPSRRGPVPMDTVTRTGGYPPFGTGNTNPSNTLRNLVLSPIKRPQLSRNRPHLFRM